MNILSQILYDLLSSHSCASFASTPVSNLNIIYFLRRMINVFYCRRISEPSGQSNGFLRCTHDLRKRNFYQRLNYSDGQLFLGDLNLLRRIQTASAYSTFFKYLLFQYTCSYILYMIGYLNFNGLLGAIHISDVRPCFSWHRIPTRFNSSDKAWENSK